MQCYHREERTGCISFSSNCKSLSGVFFSDSKIYYSISVFSFSSRFFIFQLHYYFFRSTYPCANSILRSSSDTSSTVHTTLLLPGSALLIVHRPIHTIFTVQIIINLANRDAILNATYSINIAKW